MPSRPLFASGCTGLAPVLVYVCVVVVDFKENNNFHHLHGGGGGAAATGSQTNSSYSDEMATRRFRAQSDARPRPLQLLPSLLYRLSIMANW